MFQSQLHAYDFPNYWRPLLKKIKRIVRWQNNAYRDISDGTTTKEVLIALFHRQNNLCALCGTREVLEQPSLDHIIPRRFGGRHSVHNVQWVCLFCNLSKHTGRPVTKYHYSPPANNLIIDPDLSGTF